MREIPEFPRKTGKVLDPLFEKCKAGKVYEIVGGGKDFSCKPRSAATAAYQFARRKNKKVKVQCFEEVICVSFSVNGKKRN